jgi:hypothetical protein
VIAAAISSTAVEEDRRVDLHGGTVASSKCGCHSSLDDRIRHSQSRVGVEHAIGQHPSTSRAIGIERLKLARFKNQSSISAADIQPVSIRLTPIAQLRRPHAE